MGLYGPSYNKMYVCVFVPGSMCVKWDVVCDVVVCAYVPVCLCIWVGVYVCKAGRGVGCGGMCACTCISMFVSGSMCEKPDVMWDVVMSAHIYSMCVCVCVYVCVYVCVKRDVV